MFRLVMGAVAGTVAMFVVAFILWVSPLSRIGISSATEQQSAAVQQALAANLPATGYYVVPDPGSSGGSVLYGRGPVASINYNRGGFAPVGTNTMVGGFVQEFVVSLMIAFSLYAVSARVTDFASRARLVVGLGAAVLVMTMLGDPIWMHGDWRYAIYGLIANLAMFVASGLVIAKWFLPAGVAYAEPTAAPGTPPQR